MATSESLDNEPGSPVPEEIWRLVFAHLSPVSLCRCAQVCKSWTSLVQSLDITTWRSHYLQSSEWQHPWWPLPRTEPESVSWQQAYSQNYSLSRRWLLGGREDSHSQCLLMFHRRKNRKTLHVGENCEYQTLKSALSAASDYDRILVHPGVYDEQFEMSSKIAYELMGCGELGSVVLMMCVEQNSVTGRLCNLVFKAPWFTANVLKVKSGHLQVDNCIFEDGQVQVTSPGTCHMRYTSFIRSSVSLYHVKLSLIEHCKFEGSEAAAVHVEGFPKDETNWAHRFMLKSCSKIRTLPPTISQSQCQGQQSKGEGQGIGHGQVDEVCASGCTSSPHNNQKIEEKTEMMTLKMLQDGGYINDLDLVSESHCVKDSQFVGCLKEVPEETLHSDSSSCVSFEDSDLLNHQSKAPQLSTNQNESRDLEASYNRPHSLITDLQSDVKLYNSLKKAVGCIFRNCKISDNRGGIMVCGQGQVKVIGCDLDNLQYGVRCLNNAKVVVMKCKIHHCKTSGIFMRLAATGVIAENDIFCNGEAGIDVRKDADPIIQCNRIHHGKRSGVVVMGRGQGRIISNDIYQNKEAGIYILCHGNPVISVMFYINGQHRESSAPCLYTVTGWGVMSCVCGMPFAMWQHIGQSTTATSRHRPDMTLNNKQGRAAHENLISANHWGGVDIRYGGDPIIRQNLICKGLADGAVIGEGGKGFIVDNIICGNTGCGIWVMSGDAPYINGNKIYNNTDSGIAFVTAEEGTHGHHSGPDPEADSHHGDDLTDRQSQHSDDLALSLDDTLQLASPHTQHVALVQYNNVFRNAGNGLYLNGYEPIRIYANVVHANADTGISVEQIATEEAAMVTIQDNSITCNAGCGIQVALYGQVDIRGNGIYDNSRHGMHIQTEGCVLQNDIIANQMCGIVLDRCTAVKVQENRIHSPNDVGVCVQGCTKVSFHDNVFYRGSHEIIIIHKEAESDFLMDSTVIQLESKKSESGCSGYASIQLENPSARPHIEAPQTLPTRGPSHRVMSVTTVTTLESEKCQTGSKFCVLL